MKKLKFDTIAIHGGTFTGTGVNPTSFPLYHSAAFSAESAEDMEDIFKGRKFGYIYSRISNPTVTEFEFKINALERGAGAIAASSGMAAISTILFALTESGHNIIAGRGLFAGTYLLFDEITKKYGIDIQYVDMNNPDNLQNALNSKTAFIFIESICNPALEIYDIRKISEIASGHNIPLVVDSTITTPYLFNPKEYGAAIVVHSTTKYITGNGSTIGGILVDLGNYDWQQTRSKGIMDSYSTSGSLAFITYARKKILHNTGGCISPFNAYMQNTAVETLSIRMDRHCYNAMKLAEFLKEHKKVRSVYYPGLDSSPYNDLAARQFGNKFGGIVSIRLDSKDQCFKFMNRLKLSKIAANLGDAKTLVVHPASSIYYNCSSRIKKRAGAYDDLVRISAGLENIEDIIDDFNEALEEA